MTRPYLKIKVDEKQTFGWKTLWYPGHVDRSAHKTPAAFIFARRMLKAVGKASVSRGGKTSIVYKQESPGWQSGHL